MRETGVVVIGAGQAGLSTGHHLRRYGIDDLVMLDSGDGAGGAWRHRWPSLRLGKVNGIYPLPGFPPVDADADLPASEVVSEYYASYERANGLHVLRPVEVTSVEYGHDDRLLVSAGTDQWTARAVVNATGTWTRPFWPYYPGMASFRGRQLHTADFRDVEEFRGKNVIVVGAGSSATGLLLELSELACVTWITRHEPVFRDEEFTEDVGRAAVAEVDERVRAGLPPLSVVSVTGLWAPPDVRARLESLPWRPIFHEVTPDGVRWRDGSTLDADVILWATGFRAALDHLAPLGLRAPGGGIVMDGTRVAAEPRLHLVGYGPSASTVGANRAGRAAAREIHALLNSSELAAV
ncbi:NAD(P)-binding domain-containing protein [Kibdelosporangium phytohabitans]|uniref:Pyridine nucleotide-disulfide oxidoreductase n=1 Tax=Kibdelosporangium phytohabitans TaxID=860235 RepID=A0A0N9HRA0_9PSEU|nr:NAD(P)-binding domain-containing protein [Kibdelosporangium phytohabitans]ALG07336.1 pyridine nucleotide-disulfide oxidoreductase [Kibdelosporangium phytohabitans]MBE1471796.1 cation diffusion facilitator CzcD-associated flavoprotein CzcO [Kibdelosporangium phytohabitans]